jgi:hypothetical protein
MPERKDSTFLVWGHAVRLTYDAFELRTGRAWMEAAKVWETLAVCTTSELDRAVYEKMALDSWEKAVVLWKMKRVN